MIGIVGSIVLLPIALIGLLVGFVRFGVQLVVALTDAALYRLLHTG